MCWFVRQVALDNVPLRNGPCSQSFGKNPCSYFPIVKKDQKCPNIRIGFSGERFWNFIKGLKMATFI